MFALLLVWDHIVSGASSVLQSWSNKALLSVQHIHSVGATKHYNRYNTFIILAQQSSIITATHIVEELNLVPQVPQFIREITDLQAGKPNSSHCARGLLTSSISQFCNRNCCPTHGLEHKRQELSISSTLFLTENPCWQTSTSLRTISTSWPQHME